MRVIWKVSGLVLGFSLAVNTQAIDVGLSLYLDSNYTSNTALTETDETDEFIFTPGVRLLANHDGPNLAMAVDYDLSRQIYTEDLYSDEYVATGQANLVWNALPERLDFVVDHTRTQSTISSINSGAPDNRQETSNTSAGPILRFNPRGQDELEFEYRFGDRQTDRTQTDAELHNAAVRYNLAWSPTNILTFELQQNEVDYDADIVPDIDYSIGMLTLSRESPDVSFSLMGGFNKAERTLGREDVDGAIGSLSIDWVATPATTVSIELDRDIRDQPPQLLTGFAIDELDFQTNSGVAEVFVDSAADFRITRRLANSTAVTAGVFYDLTDYEDVPLDVETTGAVLALDRQLSRTTTLSASLVFTNQEYEDQNDEADRVTAFVSVLWQNSRRINTEFGFRYRTMDSDSDLNRRNYDEWGVFARFTYTPIEQRAATL